MVTTTKYFCEIRCLNQNTVINKITCVLKTQNKTLTLHYYTLFTSGGGEANLNSVIHTGQVTSSSQSWHVGIDNHLAHIYTYRQLRERKPEYPVRTQASTGRTCKLCTERPCPSQISNNRPITTEHSTQDGVPFIYMKAAHWRIKPKMLESLGFCA